MTSHLLDCRCENIGAAFGERPLKIPRPPYGDVIRKIEPVR